ncbi:MAG TPA: nucleotidyltransferase domain-containing protein [Candidatus Nanoarchaeia archaeon]|nr:nucleotidyltransferase domain-containing protein [Candidatus Nanoarchaeia archaeon]
MSLLTEIKRNPNLRKIFGKRELIIIQKQLLGVQLKNSERTRLSRDIRKKLNVIKDLARFSEEFELKNGAEIKKLIEQTKEIISQNRLFFRIKRIILFGSVIENKLTLSSDIDIAVEFTNINKEEASKFRREILGKASEKIDIQIYNVLPDKLRKEINDKGKILYEQKNKGQD